MNPPQKYLFLFFILILLSCKSGYKKNRDYILPDGNYLILANDNQSKSIQALMNPADSTYIVLYKDTDSVRIAQWGLRHIEGHYYKIQSLLSEDLLTIVNSGKKTNEFKLVLSKDKGIDEQIWIIHRYKDDKYKISSKFNNHCLFVNWLDSDSISVNTRICNNRTTEFWKFEMKATK